MASRPNNPTGPIIEIEPYRKLVIHEVVESAFKDFIDQILMTTRAAGGTTIPQVQWCNGVVFIVQQFNPNSDVVIREQLNGVIHFGAVSFALKEKFEAEVRTPQGTIRLVDVSANTTWVALSNQLKAISTQKQA